MSFSLRYGVTFLGLGFGHHVSERNVSTFHVSAAAKHKCSATAVARKGLSPEFRATRLWRGIKKGPLWRFSVYFPVFKAQKGPQKNLRETLVTSDTRVSLVKVLPK